MINTTIQNILSRQSTKLVQAPGPNAEQLDLILQAAMRAPDHGKIMPWRFAIIRDQDVIRILDIAIKAGIANGKPIPEHKIEKSRNWLSKVPLLLAIACAPDHAGRIREEETKLSVACAVSNMQIAAHSLGFGTFWSTGVGTYLDGVGDALGFDPLDFHFMGYLSIGTPIDPVVPKERPDYRDFVFNWPN